VPRGLRSCLISLRLTSSLDSDPDVAVRKFSPIVGIIRRGRRNAWRPKREFSLQCAVSGDRLVQGVRRIHMRRLLGDQPVFLKQLEEFLVVRIGKRGEEFFKVEMEISRSASL